MHASTAAQNGLLLRARVQQTPEKDTNSQTLSLFLVFNIQLPSILATCLCATIPVEAGSFTQLKQQLTMQTY